MILRRFKIEDLDKVKEIHEKYHKDDFPLLSRDNLLSEAIIEDNGKIIAYGSTKLMGEPTLVLDTSESKIVKVKAFALLLERAIFDARSAGLEYLILATSHNDFADILLKHYDGMKEIKRRVLALTL